MGTSSAEGGNGAILITGAGKRVGARLARFFAGHGHVVHIHYNSSAGEAETLRDALAPEGKAGALVRGDLADPKAAEAVIAQCAAHEAGIRYLINCASVFDHDTAEDFSVETLHRQLDINCISPTVMVRALYRALAPHERGCAINILDYKINDPSPNFFTYTLSKLALHQATLLMARAFAPRLRVNGVAPGLTLQSQYQSDEDFARLHTDNPLLHGVEPEDLARAIAYLFSAHGSTGQVITVDGGLHFAGRESGIEYLEAEAASKP